MVNLGFIAANDGFFLMMAGYWLNNGLQLMNGYIILVDDGL